MSDWWRGAIFYQIYPRSFCDSNGDGVGDLKGAMGKLEHIAKLGCDAIWLSPFYRSPMKDYGYDVSDYRDVDPLFGSLADADAFIKRAHELGLKVMVDQVWSHSSDQHPLVRRKPRQPRQPKSRLVRLGGREAGRFAAQQLASDVRRLFVDLGFAAAAVLFAQLPARAA